MEDLKAFIKQVDSNIDFDSQASYVFFITFSRFEYALKNCGYLKKTTAKIPKAESDWDNFARTNESKFNHKKNGELYNAVEYFISHPPKLQIRNSSGGVGWLDNNLYTEKNCGDLEWLLVMVRRIRNNLFHGGKYPGFPIEEPSRNKDLLNHSIIILNECLQLESRISDCFFEYV
jgi:hypothetical protein